MEDTRNQKIEIRLTPKEKSSLKAYCENYGITISALIRDKCYQALTYQKEKEKNKNG